MEQQDIALPYISNCKPVTIKLGHLRDQKIEFHMAPWKPDETITTRFLPFDVTLTPAPGPPGNRELKQKVLCPVCTKQIELTCFQQTVLFTNQADFKKETGRILKRAIYSYICFHRDLIALLVILFLICIIPSALIPLFLKLKPGIGNIYIMIISLLFFILFLFAVLRGYQYMMLSTGQSLVSIRKAHLFRPEFHNAFNIFTRISIRGPSDHFIHSPITDRFPSRDLLALYGVTPCNLYL